MDYQQYIKPIIELLAKTEGRRETWENMERFFGKGGHVEHAKLREVCREGVTFTLDIIQEYFDAGSLILRGKMEEAKEKLSFIQTLEAGEEKLKLCFEAELRPNDANGKEMR